MKNKVLIVIGLVLTLLLVGWFIWPTQYSVRKEDIGVISPEGTILPYRKGLYREDSPILKEISKYPKVQCQIRRNRFTGEEMIRIRTTPERKKNTWVPAKGTMFTWQVGVHIIVPDEEGTYPLYLIWPREIFCRTNEMKLGAIHMRIINSELTYLPAGTKATVVETGEKATIKDGVIALDMSIEVKNNSKETVTFNPAFVITRRDGTILDAVGFLQEGKAIPQIELLPGEQITPTIVTTMIGSCKFPKGKLYLESLSYGWRFSLPSPQLIKGDKSARSLQKDSEEDVNEDILKLIKQLENGNTNIAEWKPKIYKVESENGKIHISVAPTVAIDAGESEGPLYLVAVTELGNMGG